MNVATIKRVLLALATAVSFAALAAPAPAAAAPAWKLNVPIPDRLEPGSEFTYRIQVQNIGDAVTDGTGALDVTLPPGLTGVSVVGSFGFGPFSWNCADPAGASSLHCDLLSPVGVGEAHFEGINFRVAVDGVASVSRQAQISMSGGGALSGVVRTHDFVISDVPSFGVRDGSFDGGTFTEGGAGFTQAGGHPHSASTSFRLKTKVDPTPACNLCLTPDGGALRDVFVELPPGLVGNPSVVPQCPGYSFILEDEFGVSGSKCPADSQVGIAQISLPGGDLPSGVYNMRPPHGFAAAFGFSAGGVPVLLRAELREGDYAVTIKALDASQAGAVMGTEVTLWGVPADPSHDAERTGPGCRNGGCSSSVTPQAFITNPTSCTPPDVGLNTTLRVSSWDPAFAPDSAFFESHLPPGAPLPPEQWGPAQGPTDCNLVPYDPRIFAEPSTDSASTPSGLEFELKLPPDGLLNPDGIAQGSAKRVTVSLPEGVTLNPSAGEGLSGCSRADLARERANSLPGAGCPNGSRLGSVSVKTPLLDEELTGSVYIAQPDNPATANPGAENPFDSLLALYLVIKNEQRGINVKLAGKVEPDHVTGQLRTTFDDLPQLPFSSFKLRFREGGRAPLVSPQSCGTFTTKADFVPWSAADPDNPAPGEIVSTTSQFRITRGVGGGACPSGGLPAFRPGLTAGTINNSAGRYSPFNLRLTRNDGEQEFTNFSIKLPPGVTGKLAGVPFCPDAAIAAAKDPNRSGATELASPSCPPASLVGRTLVGAGVGSVLTYVPGKVYLAGPYNGSALSIAAITSAVVGPFDVGTVVIREALKINPETAEVFIDATGSDPIPHIIDGIAVHARDIRAYVDKPEFVLNPTSCKRTSTASTVLGSGLDFASTVDDNPLTVTSPFQAADCASLGFKPRLQLSLSGGTKRGDNPALRAVLRPRVGDANSSRVSVQLPHSEFLDQSHIRTVCTRAQFNAGQGNGANCPPGSVYGHARAFTPLLSDPLEGPVFLRSSPNPLPDLVLALDGLIEFNAVGRIDSVDGGIRNTFDLVPDAPISKVILTMQGGKKGLLENSTNLCLKQHRAIAKFGAHNGKVLNSKPVLKAKCKGQRKAKKR